MLNIDIFKHFIKGHKDRVIDLLLTYQMIEILLFLKLYLPDVSKTDNESRYMEIINKELSSKTLGKLKNKYLKKFPNDKYNLVSTLELVRIERNTFMHSLYIFIASQENRKMAKITGEKILNDYSKNAYELLDKLYQLPN
ncbi:MAG: hypothetical protein PHH83_00130 [Patescibacteria group bacterium]|nr:hypothetical protein [Patescibacteria group bacterium]